MKKFILCAVLLSLYPFSAMSQVKSSSNVPADGYFKFTTTKLPLPLGRYIQLTQTSEPFKFSKPDANGDGNWTVTFNFEILRHVPNLQYCDFRMIPIGDSDPEGFRELKLKRDANAVEKLSNAISNNRSSRVAINYTANFSDLVPLEINRITKSWNGTQMQIYASHIFIPVSVNKISVRGRLSEGIRVKEAWITFSGREGSGGVNLSLDLSISTPSSSAIHCSRAIATIMTQGGKFTKCCEKKEFSIDDRIDLEDVIASRDMDVLLSNPISIDLELD